MTTQKLPGTDAARHGTGDADLTIMIAAHDAFRRDLTRLARTASAANLSDPARRRSVAAGWDLFKRQLHLHHTAEDEVIWPVLRPRLAHSQAALSVLDAMEAEHELIDPLLAAVEHALWFQVGVFLFMLALPARRGHNTRPSSVKESGKQSKRGESS